MNFRRLILQLGLFLFLGTLLQANAEEVKPREFSAYIGGSLESAYRVELKDGVITYTMLLGNRVTSQTRITPTDEQWRSFRKTLDELKVWGWQKEYAGYGVLDGTGWSLHLLYSDHLLDSKGDNNYPDAHGKPNKEPKPTKTFQLFCAAIQQLLGGKEFR